LFSKLSSKIILASLLAPMGALANDATPPDPSHKDKDATLERQLDDAQHRLEEAARQVAELSSQLGGPFFERFSTFDTTYGRAIIGVQLDPSSSKDGARVVSVSPGGPAAEAGIRPGDLIVAVNGTAVTGEDATRQVVKVIHDAKPDSKITVSVKRDGKTLSVLVVARAGPGVMAFGADGLPPPLPTMPQVTAARPFFMIQGPLSNMELVTLTPQLGKYFGTEKGVLVVRAPPEGDLKLEDGDVILAIDGREPTSGSHATRILGSYQPGEKLSLKIVRQRKTMDLETTVPEERRNFLVPGREHDMPRPRPGKVIIRQRDDDTI
jgi:C-terminal processing protease CtpA/Prc